MKGAARWRGTHSEEARRGHGVAEAHCVRCHAASGLRLVDGEFVCSNVIVCERRQQGQLETAGGYDLDLER